MFWLKKIFIVLLLFVNELALAELENSLRGPIRKNAEIQLANPNVQNRVHRVGNIWMNITNFGFFGNYSIRNANRMQDPEYPGTYAPQAVFPAGSNQTYLYQAAIWVGALVQEEGREFPRVSVGTDGWVRTANNTSIIEFWPGEGPQNGIQERSTRPNAYNRLGQYVTHDSAVSEQDFILSYTDTLKENFFVAEDPIDGQHFPLGIKVTQKSYAFSYAYAKDYIFFEWEFENIATNYLKNIYVGLYVDGDIGDMSETPDWHNDDICGFQRYYVYQLPDGRRDSSLVNVAYIVDNDGRPYDIPNGSDFSAPHVLGSRVLRAPNPSLKTSFNWWISNGNEALDFGPSWIDDNAPGSWTNQYGTPMGDARKYFVLSNREFDYDQIYTNNPVYLANNPQEDLDNPGVFHQWKNAEEATMNDLADGYDTRYLLSWGPLGVFDHFTPTGERVFRLNPGEKFTMAVAFVAGLFFHNPNNPQTSNTVIDPEKFNFATIQYAADWASRVYDNPMRDTPTRNHPKGDGWYGEDTGTDFLYAKEIGDSVIIDNIFIGYYPGPDLDGSEKNNRLDFGEDNNPYKPQRYWYTSNNQILDLGDGEADFLGPPPPPIPQLKTIAGDNWVELVWTPFPSEDPNYLDPFSNLSDFEGYKIYVSETGLENEFSLLAVFDKVNYAYFHPLTDSLATIPDDRSNARNDTIINGVYLVRRKVGLNTGFHSIWNPTDSTYRYRIVGVPPLFPRYYAVTAYDYGDPRVGTPSLETSKNANKIYTAPSRQSGGTVQVVPNPYRVDVDYTRVYGNGLAWENRDDGTPVFYPQEDRRIYFYNLPKQALIRIFTVSGDLVTAIPHNIAGDLNIGVNLEYAESWNLKSRNEQMVTSGLYLFSVEDKTPEGNGKIYTGKFVIIR